MYHSLFSFAQQNKIDIEDETQRQLKKDVISVINQAKVKGALTFGCPLVMETSSPSLGLESAGACSPVILKISQTEIKIQM